MATLRPEPQEVMTVSISFHRSVAAVAALVLSFTASPAAPVTRIVVGPVALSVPDGFKDVAGKTPTIRQEASGIAIEASELPPQALHEFKGPAFLEFLQSLGYTDATYADGGLKRAGPYTYVLADAKGAQGPESRFLLVIGGEGRAAIVTAYAPKSEIANGHASRATIEAVLDTAEVLPAPAAKP
ncbi:MAG: hypothetical protein QM780_05915 [Hyphomicrobium sp.]|uniref:hypothetical protein n=1 Tax=Hyphomicrobium sp. TaxID=82 RepID=UPI0039E691CE